MEKFADLFLKTALYKKLVDQITSNNFNQTNLISSKDEFSNNLFSRLIAYALICENSCYCKTCENCIKLESNTHPDLKEFSKDKNFIVANAGEILDDVYKSAYFSNKVISKLALGG